MRIINKQSKKELENRIFELEEQIERLKENPVKHESSINVFTDVLLKYVDIEGIDILSYNSNEDSFVNLNVGGILHVLSSVPHSLSSLQERLQVENNDLLTAKLKKSIDKKSAKITSKYISGKEGAKDNRPIDITILSDNEAPTKFLFVIKDNYAESKQKRELSRTKEKIEESDKLKSTILSNISHHIRTPLNSVTGFAELLAENEYDIKKRKEYIDIIKRQSKRILTLIDDISEIARLESGDINISKTPCNLNLMLNELLMSASRHRAEKRKEEVKIVSEFPQEGINLLTDPGRLLQALSHIINHSLRYTKSGEIKLGYKFIDEKQKVEFFIQDTSYGLTKEEQKLVFNKFTSVENPESTRMDDPGLGLTIARIIIKALGGKIWVESEEGEGSKFILNIPFEPVPTSKNIEEEVANEIVEGPQYEWPNKVILIVDDEEVNAMFLDAVFHGTSAQVIFAKNGQEAIDLCHTINKIDLILMDLKMPVMDGLNATKEIRKFNTKIPIIAQTALAAGEDRHNCEVAGCNDIITKPIEVRILLKLVNKYISD